MARTAKLKIFGRTFLTSPAVVWAFMVPFFSLAVAVAGYSAYLVITAVSYHTGFGSILSAGLLLAIVFELKVTSGGRERSYGLLPSWARSTFVWAVGLMTVWTMSILGRVFDGWFLVALLSIALVRLIYRLSSNAIRSSRA